MLGVYTCERNVNFPTLMSMKLLLGIFALIVIAGCSSTVEPPATQPTKLQGGGQQSTE
jgi:hypothetical protein